MTDTPALEIVDLKYRYPRGSSDAPPDNGTGPEWIVDVPRLTLGPAEQMLLTGGSGSGKSTLLHIIAGLADPTSGRVNVAGRNIHALHGAARDLYRGRHVGMIFQTFNLLHGFSALENVMAALMFSEIPRHEHKPRAARLLEQLGIKRTSAKPDELSVGQQQRIAVARAVACDPALVLADEPTASLDPENSAGAMDLIQEACRDRNAALLCVSHDPSMTSRFQLRASLDQLRTRAATQAHA